MSRTVNVCIKYKEKILNIVISEYFGFKHIYATSANKVYIYLYSNNER